MKTLLRTLLYLALIVWLGAEIFFPVVAAITFGTLPGDTHTAGTIVGELLRILHAWAWSPAQWRWLCWLSRPHGTSTSRAPCSRP